ncbi:hypothetical protein PR048_033419, partial [Dryococelus australis]
MVLSQLMEVCSRNVSGNNTSKYAWEGLEIRLLRLISQTLNFKIQFKNFPAMDRRSGQASGVVAELMTHRAHIGLAGFYVTTANLKRLTLSAGHSIDCATFITRTSTALPRILEKTQFVLCDRYRAIMGPFHWSVWLALTLTYLLAIFPIAFSHRHSLSHLLKDPWEMENMFWYVFGTFTNCFTFSGKQSWTSAEKGATRMFIGTYWLFSIIVTACYTGSIIAFVTLPLYPEFIDSVRQVYDGGYKVAMLDGEGWQHYFNNSYDLIATKVLKKVEYLSAIEDGLKNLTKRRNSGYAVFGSRDKFDFILRANFTHGDASKRTFLHIAKQCFVPFHVALGFPHNAPHSDAVNQVLLRAVQSGLVLKLKREVDFEMRRSVTGKLLQVRITQPQQAHS